ncbi:MAG: hypothetical protein NTX45_08165 [Proteobacteria bacterium]|nr:hypothetical protein [Pseudomonadota bacterium]
MSEEIEPTVAISAVTKPTGLFVKVMFVIFFWCMGGVVVIYGIRLYHDLPINPTFIPIIGAVFAAVLSFILVMTLQIYSGKISIQFGADKKFDGASGPIVLWCLCFLTVAYGLYLLGINDVAKAAPSSGYVSCSAWDAWRKLCPSQAVKKIQAPAEVVSTPVKP